MDPDKALENLRETLQLYRDRKERGDPWEFTVPLLEDLADIVQNLDEWIMSDGFLPADWTPKEN